MRPFPDMFIVPLLIYRLADPWTQEPLVEARQSMTLNTAAWLLTYNAYSPLSSCRLAAADQVTKFLDAAPKKELENILHLVCNIFKVDNALIALFGDRRIYILNTVGGFKVCARAVVAMSSV